LTWARSGDAVSIASIELTSIVWLRDHVRPGRALDLGGEEAMRDAARTLEGFEGLRSVKQIDRNVRVPAFDIRFATAYGDHIPVVQSKKVAQKISAHDSRRTGNQRLLAVRHRRARI
jgi:hypothetical protein